jgi:hypothetical protein
MSKYYCKSCGSVFEPGFVTSVSDTGCTWKDDEDILHFSHACPYCDNKIKPIPDYETPAHYKERTGKVFPDDGAVWVRSQFTDWELYYFSEAGNVSSEERIVVVANSPVPPPDNWNPE